VNSILEALRKSSEAPPSATGPATPDKGFLFQKSPYDSASVYWERRRMTDDKGLRRTARVAMILGAASVVMTLALLAYIAIGLKEQKNPVESLPQPQIVQVVTVTPTPTPEVAVPAYIEPVETLPLPDEQPLPLDLPEFDDIAIVEPDASPRPLDLSQEPALPTADSISSRRPTPLPQPARRAFHLQGIIWDDQSPMAMINGRSVRVGDKIWDAKVTQINRNSVTLDSDGEKLTLK